MALYSTKSTFRCNESSRSSFILTKSNKLMLFPSSTRISTSLVLVNEPVANDPKIPALLILFRLTIGRTCFFILSISFIATSAVFNEVCPSPVRSRKNCPDEQPEDQDHQ